MRSMDQSEIKKKRIERLHQIFFILDSTLTIVSFILTWVFIKYPTILAFFLYYCIFYIGQSIQHYLSLVLHKIDIIKYDKLIKRYLAMISIIELTYFILVFIYWTKSTYHPIYGFVNQVMKLPVYLGLLFIVHFIVTLFVYIQFLHDYISRKYYLLALGGFDVQLRLIQQRQENLRQLALIEPFYNEYPIADTVSRPVKSYKFQDIIEDVEGQEVCSICLTRQKDGLHPILTDCKHYFHRECIQEWAKVNSKCPECRAQFKQAPKITTQEKPAQIIDEIKQ